MLKMLAGAILGSTLFAVTGSLLFSAVVLAITGITCQIAYARCMFRLLGGADPVATFGARSLHELGTMIPLPFSIIVLEFFAKTCGWGVIAQLVLWF